MSGAIKQGYGACCFHWLPNEILIQVLISVEPFSSGPPSVSNIHKEPSLSLVRQPNWQPLKDLSIVCKRWRRLLLPEIFQYSCVHLQRRPRWLELTQGVLQYLSRPGRTEHEQRIFESIKRDIKAQSAPKVSPGPSSKMPTPTPSPTEASEPGTDFSAATTTAHRDTDLVQSPMAVLEYIKDSDAMLLSPNGPPEYYWRWIPSLKGALQRFLDFVSASEIKCYVKSFVLLTDVALDSDKLTGAEEALLQREVKKLWKAVFRTLGGSGGLDRVVVAAPPGTMAALTSSREGPADTWAFNMPLHYVEFSMDPVNLPTTPWGFQSGQCSATSSGPTTPYGSPNAPGDSTESRRPHHPFYLYNAQAWSQLHYNEGASIAAYGHYEWHWKKPPQTAYHLLSWLAKASRCPYPCATQPALRAITITSLFPFSSHMRALAGRVREIRSVNVLRVRLADPDLLEDRARLGSALAEDCWSEWRAAYVAVAREAVMPARPDFVFESLDGGQPTTRAEVERCFDGSGLLEKGVVRIEGEDLRWVKQRKGGK